MRHPHLLSQRSPLRAPPAEGYGRKDREAPLQFKASHDSLLIKASDDDADPEGTISGYGSKFGLVDSYNETVKKGAFRASLAEWRKSKKPIPMLWQHDSGAPIGAWTSYSEDDTGLLLKGRLLVDDVPQAKQALALIKADVVTGLSIGYYEVEADAYYDPEREGPRVLKKLDLRETSVVTFPALREAQLDAIKARVARGERPTNREFRALIQRELGLSRRDAEEIADLGFKTWLGREAGNRDDDEDEKGAADHLAELNARMSKPLFP